MGANLPSDSALVGIVIERGDVSGERPSEVVAAAVEPAFAGAAPNIITRGAIRA